MEKKKNGFWFESQKGNEYGKIAKDVVKHCSAFCEIILMQNLYKEP